MSRADDLQEKLIEVEKAQAEVWRKGFNASLKGDDWAVKIHQETAKALEARRTEVTGELQRARSASEG